MKNTLKVIFSQVLILLFVLTMFTGCFKKDSSQDPQTDDYSSNDSSTGCINPLTGLDIEKDKVNLRPVCVMTNNMKKAQPLHGVSDADILFECLIEGGITRIMQVHKDIASAPTLGTVRSARPYFINLAHGLGAIYVHLGGSFQAYDILKSGYINSIDLITNGNYMWRDAARRKNLGLEHSAFTSGEKLVQAINKKGYNTQIDNNYKFKMNFSNDSPVLSGKDATKLIAKFSGYKSTVFDYDEKNQTYLVSQFDKPQMDGNKNIQNSKPNVIILRAETSQVPKTELLNINLIGSGEGYYMSHGKIIEINWKRNNDNELFTYSTKDGKDVPLLKGQTYVCVMTKTAPVTFS